MTTSDKIDLPEVTRRLREEFGVSVSHRRLDAAVLIGVVPVTRDAFGRRWVIAADDLTKVAQAFVPDIDDNRIMASLQHAGPDKFRALVGVALPGWTIAKCVSGRVTTGRPSSTYATDTARTNPFKRRTEDGE